MTPLVDRSLDQLKPVYLGGIFSVHVLYFAAFFGILYVNPMYIRWLNLVIQCFVCVFLIVRFNPFRKDLKLKPLDNYIIFGSAIILATNLLAVEIAKVIANQSGVAASTAKTVLNAVSGYGTAA